MLTKEQLEFRRNRIGASDAPILMGVSPYKTKYQLWQEKTSGNFQPANFAMQYGNDNEEPARQLFEQMTGIVMFKQEKPMIHPKRDWQIATLDGIDFDYTAFVEIKCANKADHACAKKGTVPKKYYPQLQHQMEVTGLNSGYYFSYHMGEGAIVQVDRDNDYIKNMNEIEEEFYQTHIVKGIAPEQDVVEMNSLEWDLLAEKYKVAYKELKYYEEMEKALREDLICLAGNKSCVGRGILLTTSTRAGTIDYDKIPELQNVDREQYRKAPSTTWRVTVK